MNKKELIKNLITDIQDIYSITNRFEHTEQIHPLDIDLALSKVRNLYELLLKLNPQGSYITENQEKEISTSIEQLEKEENPPKQKKQESAPIIKQEEETIKAEVKEEQPKHEPEFIIETAADKKEQENKEKADLEDELEEETEQRNEEKHIESSPEIVADKFQSKKFIHDNIAKKNTKKDVSSKLQSKPIHDINSAIGLNDKFIFIRELFDNNKEQYHETIQILNNFDTFENAVEFLKENFDWDEEDQNFERLKELVRRKYAAKQ